MDDKYKNQHLGLLCTGLAWIGLDHALDLLLARMAWAAAGLGVLALLLLLGDLAYPGHSLVISGMLLITRECPG